jgi:hypothetical protein
MNSAKPLAVRNDSAKSPKKTMEGIMRSWIAVTIFLFTIYATSNALAQECSVVDDNEDGSYLVQIGDKQLLAISEEMERNVLKIRRDLLDAQREIFIKDSLLATYELAKAQYDTTLKRQKEYIAELESILDDYKKLVKDLKRLKGEPWFTVSGGVGVTGDGTDPAVLMGLGIRRFRVWGFFQKDNAGVVVGMALPLF